MSQETMQALSVAIGQSGIEFFTSRYVADKIVTAFKNIKPQDMTWSVGSFNNIGVGFTDTYDKFVVKLSNGNTKDFSPEFKTVTQKSGGEFSVETADSDGLDITYDWDETYDYLHYTSHGCVGPYPRKNKGSYTAHYNQLTATVGLNFIYRDNGKTYDIVLDEKKTDVAGKGLKADVPGSSALKVRDAAWWHGFNNAKVPECIKNAASHVDFKTPLDSALGHIVKSIPASGNLTPDIKYEFALGKDGLNFPNDNGIKIGITGRVFYKGEEYPGVKPEAVPLPPVPTGTEHLNLYVTDYELNALHWAYHKAGKLNSYLKPADLPNPDVLKCKSYKDIKGLNNPAYQALAMYAQVQPQEPPVASFQTVWIFTNSAVETLKSQLPTDLAPLLDGMNGNAYVDAADLEKVIQATKLAKYLDQIKDATKAAGMAVKSNVRYMLTIQTGDPTPPQIVFTLVREDVLQKLGLGMTPNGAQTMTYSFTHVRYTVTLDKGATTVPNFDQATFGSWIWPFAGESAYTDTLQRMGKIGVPMPIMEGFSFVFEEAKLSIQEKYVWVLAKVKFK